MARIYQSVRQILNGRRTINNRIKYTSICVGIAWIHLTFAIGFSVNNMMPFFWYNALITMIYLYHSFVSIPKDKYMFVFFSSFIEILSFSSVASIMLGWDWGFTMYTVALVPVAFYLTYTMPNLKRKILFPVVSSLIVSECFILVRVACGQINPLFQGDYPDELKYGFYYFNVIIAFWMLVLFSSLFALEISYMQRQLERENRNLGKIANYDPLTHLLNRRSMNEKLREAMSDAEHNNKLFSLLMIDIDDFKKVNDTYGHDCGDEVLVSVASTIERNVRESDEVARWGGEEILVLVKQDLDIAGIVAERIRKDISEKKHTYKNIEINISVTIGVAGYKENQTLQEMIQEADANLYYGKNHGKNQVVISERKEESFR